MHMILRKLTRARAGYFTGMHADSSDQLGYLRIMQFNMHIAHRRWHRLQDSRFHWHRVKLREKMNAYALGMRYIEELFSPVPPVPGTVPLGIAGTLATGKNPEFYYPST